jgi:hypothetical protein
MEVTLNPHEALGPPLLAVLFAVFSVSAQQKAVTIATVNNSDITSANPYAFRSSA